MVSSIGRPPSIFTICAPAAMISAALRKASCGLIWKVPKGMSPMMKAFFAPRATQAV